MQCMAHWTCMCAPVRECGVHVHDGSKKACIVDGCLVASGEVACERCVYDALRLLLLLSAA
jgi:hypothetical protein